MAAVKCIQSKGRHYSILHINIISKEKDNHSKIMKCLSLQAGILVCYGPYQPGSQTDSDSSCFICSSIMSLVPPLIEADFQPPLQVTGQSQLFLHLSLECTEMTDITARCSPCSFPSLSAVSHTDYRGTVLCTRW